MDSTDLMKAFLKLGDLAGGENQSLEDKVAYKERIVFATMRANIPDWEVPEHYKNLDTKGKLELLEKLQNMD